MEVVVRHAREQVVAFCQEYDDQLVIADQDDVKGTGRAVECGLDELPDDLAGTVLVTYGDVPLLTADTLRELTAAHDESGSSVSVVTARVPDPTGYGRVIRDVDGQVERIVEQKDATDDERAITEVNSGIYAFEATLLTQALAGLGTDNAQGEKYLTDVLALARAAGHRVGAHGGARALAPDPSIAARHLGLLLQFHEVPLADVYRSRTEIEVAAVRALTGMTAKKLQPLEDLVEDSLNDYVKRKNEKLCEKLEKSINKVTF